LLDTGDVAGIAADEQGIGPEFFVEPQAGARLHDEFAHLLILGLRAVAPVDLIGLTERGDVAHPVCDMMVGGEFLV